MTASPESRGMPNSLVAGKKQGNSRDRESLSTNGIGATIHAAADEGEITRQEAELLVRSLLSAGFDTTVGGIGAAMRALAANPDQFVALRPDPSKARAAFKEAVRLESPVQTFFSTTTRDVTLGGAPIPEGETLLAAIARAIASLEPDGQPTPLFNNTLRGWMPVRAMAA
jgi:cytochrome P450